LISAINPTSNTTLDKSDADNPSQKSANVQQTANVTDVAAPTILRLKDYYRIEMPHESIEELRIVRKSTLKKSTIVLSTMKLATSREREVLYTILNELIIQAKEARDLNTPLVKLEIHPIHFEPLKSATVEGEKDKEKEKEKDKEKEKEKEKIINDSEKKLKKLGEQINQLKIESTVLSEEKKSMEK